MDKISFANLASAAHSAGLALDAHEEEAKSGKKPMGLPPGFRGWSNVKAQIKLTGGKLPGFLCTTSNHLARHERQTQVRIAHETQRAMLVAKATRKFRGRTATDLFRDEIKAKQDLVDEKVNKLAFHEKVQSQYDASQKQPHFMQLTENQADRASDIIRKRDDWEVRRKAKANKEVRKGNGLTTTDLYRMEQEQWKKEGNVKLHLPGTNSATHPPRTRKKAPKTQHSAPPNAIALDNTNLQARANFDYAQAYNYMRPTHSSQSHVRNHYGVEYTADWQDRQYLQYDRLVNKKNCSPRNYLAPQLIPPRKHATTTVHARHLSKTELKKDYLPAMAAHLNKVALSPYAPSIRHIRNGAKSYTQMRFKKSRPGAQTARPGARSQQIKRPAPPAATARREVPTGSDLLEEAAAAG